MVAEQIIGNKELFHSLEIVIRSHEITISFARNSILFPQNTIRSLK